MSEMIGRLRVALGLETAAFEKGAKRAGAEIDAFGTKAEKAGFKVGSAAKAIVAGGVALAGSALVSELKAVVEESLNYAKALGQMSKLSNASVEEFQQAAYAAKSVGIESEKLADIYKDVNDKVGEFLQTGGGEMKDFFEHIAPKVGVTAEQFRNLSGPQALQLYVSTLEKAGVNQQEMTFYMEAIADEASALAPLLRNSGEGFRMMGDEAKKAGIILTQDQISQAGETAKKIDALKTALSVRVSAVVIENSEAIGKMAESLANLLEKMLKLVDLGAQFANSPAGKLLGMVNTGVSYLNPVTGAMQVLDTVSTQLDGKKSTGGSAGVKATPTAAWGKTTTAPLLNGRSAYSGLATNYAGGGILPTAAGTFAGMQPGDASGLFMWTTNASAAQAKALAELSEEADEAGQKVEAANVRIAQSFGEMAQDSVNALDRLASAVQSGGAVNILSAILGLGLQLGKVGLFGKTVQTNLNTTVPAYAGGTSFHPGGLAMVGERGPEIVSLPRGSAVYPNGTGPGGGSVTNYFSGNLLTPEFWGQINAGHAMAAQAGGEIGFRKVVTRGRRRVA